MPWRDGTVLVGATVEDVGFDERTTVAGVRDLLEAACELLPRRADGTVRGRAASVFVPARPTICRSSGRRRRCPNLMYATGHYRNGVLLAPLTAELVADAMLDGVSDPLLELTSPQRFGGL